MAIINGDAGNNRLTGTAGADQINGQAGNDTLTGLAGNDIYKFGGSFGSDEVVEQVGGGNDLLQILTGIPTSAVRLVGDRYDNLYVIADGYGSIRLEDHLTTVDVERLQIGTGPVMSLTGGLTMTGSSSGDSIYGTRFGDAINGATGNDMLTGGGGNDIYKFGGSFGSDEVVEQVGGGNDLLQILTGIPTSAVRLVGDRYDNLYVIADGYGSIRLEDHLTTVDVERLQIGTGPVMSLTGGLTMTGSSSGDSIYGTRFGDAINGATGNDMLTGGGGDDIYKFGGRFGSDEVVEQVGGGNDLLQILTDIPASAVRLVGDRYDNLYVIADGYGSIRLEDHLTTVDVERLQIGTGPVMSLTGGLTMTGSSSGDFIYGTRFGDAINGATGNDMLTGGGGDDIYKFGGRFGSDEVVEQVGGGNDLLQILTDIPASAVRLVGDRYDNLYVIADGYGSIRLEDHLTTVDVERLQIGTGPVMSLTGGLTMTGSSSGDFIYGTRFGDAINGATGNDTLTGGDGNDVMNGGTGSDLLIGGIGKDRSTGGDGGDRFIFDEYVELGVGASRDVITDFSKAQRDMIDLSDLDAQPSASGSQGFTFIGTTAFSINTPGQVHYYASGGTTIVELNTDADKAAEYQIELTGTIGLSASDFYL